MPPLGSHSRQRPEVIDMQCAKRNRFLLNVIQLSLSTTIRGRIISTLQAVLNEMIDLLPHSKKPVMFPDLVYTLLNVSMAVLLMGKPDNVVIQLSEYIQSILSLFTAPKDQSVLQVITANIFSF